MHAMIWYSEANAAKKFQKLETMLSSFESMKTVATFIAHITTMIDNAQNKVGTLAGTLLI